ncbi:hypothetical protein GQ600_21024 [Phytophthora cactorum]|nr:hypothetical protein GQ600_21024 [Phytophthora cactorum]
MLVQPTKQHRKECTSRKLRLSRKTTAADRVKHLVEFDAIHVTVFGTVMGSSNTAKTPVSLRTKNCIFRLLNILFLTYLHFASPKRATPRPDSD